MLFLNLSSLPAVFLTFLLFVASSPAALASNAGLDHKLLARSSPETWTNAQRLAAGLPPLAPRRFKRATPTEPNVARRAAPSPSPSAHVKHLSDGNRLAAVTTYTGTLQARTVSGNASLGFVRLSSSGVALGGDEASRVTFTAVGIMPFSIATVTDGAKEEEPSFLGAVGKTAIASGSASAATLSNVVQTPTHARPASSQGSESAIWTIDANTRKLTALWVNPDGSHTSTVLAHSASDGALVLIGDLDAYNRAHPDAPVSEVALYLVSN